MNSAVHSLRGEAVEQQQKSTYVESEIHTGMMEIVKRITIILSPPLVEQLDHQQSQSMLGYDDPTKVVGRCTSP